MKWRILAAGLIVTIWTLVSLPAVCAEKKADRAESLKGGGPIEIVSDRLDAYNEEKLVVFSGNVVATQKDKVIRANQLFVYYKKKKDDKAAKNPATDTEAGDLDKIEAKGNVRITQGKRIVTGEDGVFYNDEQKIVMTGNPVMTEGNNVIRGDKIIVLLDEDRGVVESSKEKRVTAIIYPEEAKKTKK